MKTFRSLLIAGFFAVCASQALADWREDLEEQMKEEHECKVAFYSNVVERRVDEQQVVIARVHCMDRRSFDAMRSDEFELFDIKECIEEAC